MARSFLICFCITALSLGCSSRHDAQQRIAQYFNVPAERSPNLIREQLLKKFPVGTSEAAIIGAIQHSAIGRDHVSSYYPAGARNIITVRTGFRGLDVVYTEYGIRFVLGADRRLEDIQVEEWLTGP